MIQGAIDLLGTLPFEWARYPFMIRALIAVLIISPTFAIFGCFLLSNRMVLFGDVVAHAGLAGAGLGLLLGALDPTVPMLLFAIFIAVLLSLLRRVDGSISDTSVGFLMSFVSALGVVLITRGGDAARITRYLTGDLLTLGPDELNQLLTVSLIGLGCLALCSNWLVLSCFHRSLAESRSIPVFRIEVLFTTTLAVTVTLAMPMVGVLVLGSLLIIPPAISKVVTSSFRSFVWIAVLASTVIGILGLLVGFYFDSAIGATIALLLTVAYGFALATFGRRT